MLEPYARRPASMVLREIFYSTNSGVFAMAHSVKVYDTCIGCVRIDIKLEKNN